MQITSITQTIHSSTPNNLQDIMNNLSFEDKRVLREALMSVDSKDLPKVIKEISKIPPNTDYLKNLLTTIDNYKKSDGFVIYA